MRVLICGGRDFNDRDFLASELSLWQFEHGPITHLIHGGARGADTLAGSWAEAHIGTDNITVFMADWKKHGRGAGHIRNQQMLDEGKPKHVIAFPGGRGTDDMISRSKQANVPVTIMKYE